MQSFIFFDQKCICDLTLANVWLKMNVNQKKEVSGFQVGYERKRFI